MSTSLKVLLPLVDGSRGCLHAVLERDPFNTITLHLQPDVLIINRSSITLQLLTKLTENVDGNAEAIAEGGEREREIVTTLHPNDISLLPQNKVVYSKHFWLLLLFLCVSSFICLLSGRINS